MTTLHVGKRDQRQGLIGVESVKSVKGVYQASIYPSGGSKRISRYLCIRRHTPKSFIHTRHEGIVKAVKAMASSHFQRPTQRVRIGSLRGFLPLSDDIASARGQTLPSLIQNESSANLHNVRSRLERKQQSTNNQVVDRDEDQVSNSNENDIERGDVGKSNRLHTTGEPEQDRTRRSTASDILMTPQMRSMRLIGNSNPRYQW